MPGELNDLGMALSKHLCLRRIVPDNQNFGSSINQNIIAESRNHFKFVENIKIFIGDL